VIDVIDVKKAYKQIKELPNRNHLVECCDFGGFWGFIFTEKDPGGEAFASRYDCVNKVTGEVFNFNPPDDFELFSKGVMLPVDQFNK
jgi:hypothetical protein